MSVFRRSILSYYFLHPISISIYVGRGLSSCVGLHLGIRAATATAAPAGTRDILFPNFFGLGSVAGEDPAEEAVTYDAVLGSGYEGKQDAAEVNGTVSVSIVNGP